MPVYRLEAGSYTSKMLKCQIIKKYILLLQMMKIYKFEKDKMTEK
jgi:hypothetical protein